MKREDASQVGNELSQQANAELSLADFKFGELRSVGPRFSADDDGCIDACDCVALCPCNDACPC
jgi:hypothetical protein